MGGEGVEEPQKYPTDCNDYANDYVTSVPAEREHQRIAPERQPDLGPPADRGWLHQDRAEGGGVCVGNSQLGDELAHQVASDMTSQMLSAAAAAASAAMARAPPVEWVEAD